MRNLACFAGLLLLAVSGTAASAAISSPCRDAKTWPPEHGTYPDRELNAAFSSLAKFYPHFKSIKAIRQSPDADDQLPGPVASLCPDGSPLMIFPIFFVDLVRTAEPGGDNYWKWLFLFAHEYSHVALNHILLADACRKDAAAPASSCSPYRGSAFSQRNELEADFWAAFTLALMGANVDQAKNALRSMATLTVPHDNEHPAYDVRERNVEEAWRQASIPNYIAVGNHNSLSTFIMLENIEIKEHELYSFPTPSIANCAATCSQKAPKTCAAFSYDKWEHFCYLKAAPNDQPNQAARPFAASDMIMRFEASSDTGIRSSFGQPLQQNDNVPGFIELTASQKEHCNTFGTRTNKMFYDAGKTPSPPLPTSDSCASRCRGDAKCNAFTFIDGQCKIFERVGGAFSVEDPKYMIHVREYAYDKNCAWQH